jgi:DNA polymerase-3 subunit epsilon
VFTVVDLETTGLAPETERITEIGAVRLRGPDVLAEFETLVAPGVPVPAPITALTGISDATVAGAPRLRAVLPEFLAFARGDVLVAHNAPFDLAFLRTACERHGYAWPGFEVVDTLSLARALIPQGAVPDFRLPTLARHLGAPLPPTHRAVEDARATAHVLRRLIGLAHRAGAHDVRGLRALAGE